MFNILNLESGYLTNLSLAFESFSLKRKFSQKVFFFERRVLGKPKL